MPVAGLLNSATELMTPEKFWQLVTSPQTAWLVAKHREVKDSLVDPKWTYDRDFLEYDAMMSSWKKNSREGRLMRPATRTRSGWRCGVTR